jgi:dihydroxyacid dehydratase/phosphogluconate dehydratase
MHIISVWDRTSIKYTTVVITTSGLSAAMLDLMVVGNSTSFALHVLALAVPESTIIAFEIYILSQIQPEIWELPFYCRHLGFPV